MITLVPEKCVACKKCIRQCPFGAIRLEGKTPVLTELCTGCGACIKSCPAAALAKPSPGEAYAINKYACASFRTGAGACSNCMAKCARA